MTLEMASNLVLLRKKSGLSQEELALKLGISRQAVSKWERAEASPDTDNLVELAKIYQVSLDELLLGRAAGGQTPSENGPESDEAPNPDSPPQKATVSVTPGEVHVVDARRDTEVHITPGHVFVSEGGGEKGNANSGEPCENGGTPHERRWQALRKFPFPVVAVIVYLAFGFFAGNWHPSWLVFLSIPLYYSLIEALEKHNPQLFAFPVAILWIYLAEGFARSLWHPLWVLFLTVPIYYSVCEWLKKK